MNQILVTSGHHRYFLEDSVLDEPQNQKKYVSLFFISIGMGTILLCYLLFSSIVKFHQKRQTNILNNQYKMSTLYPSTNQYHCIQLSNEIAIIGLIEIPSIHISYPILSNTSDSLLKISVCKFAGPLPNRNGNLCIAGHNYKNRTMFSKLDKLEINDSIFITDLNHVRLEYVVYQKLKVKQNNLDCAENTTDVQITLITCNAYNNKERIVVKAKVKE